MIEIVDVSKAGFPIVDFKFQNRGRATAFLHKFTVHILSAKIDPTPVLSHFISFASKELHGSFESHKGTLAVQTRNGGWGNALDCAIRLDSFPLNELFTEEVRTFRGDIPQGEKVTAIILDPAGMDSVRFKQLLESPKSVVLRTSYFERRHAAQEGVLAVPLPVMKAELVDIDGKRHASEGTTDDSWMPGDFGSLSLCQTGFIWDSSIVCACAITPTSRYFVSIDPEATETRKTYSISHTVDSGKVERFQLALGAPKSCNVRLKFSFQVDGEGVLNSDEFDINIWAPRESRSYSGYYHYEDGDEMLSRVAERAAKLQARPNEKNKDSFDAFFSWRLEGFLKSRFPFLSDRDDDHFR